MTTAAGAARRGVQRMALPLAAERKADAQHELVLGVLVAEDLAVHQDRLLVVVERLRERKLVPPAERRPPSLGRVVERRAEEVRRMLGLVQRLAAELAMVAELDAERPVVGEAIGGADQEIEDAVVSRGAVLPFLLALEDDVGGEHQPVVEEVLLQQQLPFELV